MGPCGELGKEGDKEAKRKGFRSGVYLPSVHVDEITTIGIKGYSPAASFVRGKMGAVIVVSCCYPAPGILMLPGYRSFFS